MAKALRGEPPSSSIVRLLDLSAAARATAAPLPQTPVSTPSEPVLARTAAKPVKPSAPTARGSATVNREVVLTPETDAVLTDLVVRARTTTCTKLTTSHVFRALLRVVAHRSGELQHAFEQLGPLKLPSNAAGFEDDRERFEASLADALLRALSGAEG
jgi:hypothetical protein